MRLFRRCLGLTLLALLLARPTAAQGQAAPGRLTQFPGTPEPPLARPLPGPGPTPETAPPPAGVPVLPAPPAEVGPAFPPPPPPVVGPPVVKPAHAEPPVPVVAIRVRVPACGAEGQELKYLICVDNTSPAAAHHVLVRVTLPANVHLARAEPPPVPQDGELLWALGTLPGLTCKEIWLVLVPAGTDEVKLCARVQFEHGQCVCTRVARAAPPAVVPVPVMPHAEEPAKQPGKQPAPEEKVKPAPKGEGRLKVTIKGPKQQLVKQPAAYTITLTNPGSGPATNTLITAAFPDKMKFVSATEGGRHLAGQVAWLPGTLEPGASKTVDVILTAEAPGELCVRAGALADNGLSDTAEACTVFKGASAVLLKMVDTKDPIAVGEETSYVIEVVNQGSVPITNARIKAILPDELGLVDAKGPTDHRTGARVKEGQELLFEPYPSLPAEATIRYEVFAKGVRPGDARFRIVLTADQLQAGGPVREEESTMVFQDTAHAVQVRRLKTRGR
jgi:uncharacterized repeat protein (TIGR01451 family)